MTAVPFLTPVTVPPLTCATAALLDVHEICVPASCDGMTDADSLDDFPAVSTRAVWSSEMPVMT